MAAAAPDVALALAEATPRPVLKYVQQRLDAIGTSSSAPNEAWLFLITAPQSILELTAESVGLQKALHATAKRTWPEEVFPMREFRCAGREAHLVGGTVPFSPAERASLLHAYLDKALTCDEAWPAALAASGRAEAASCPQRSWLVGPRDDWANQPLLSALGALGLLRAVGPLPSPRAAIGVEAVGLPIARAHWGPWVLEALQGRPVCPERIRAHWGERVAFYFAWQQFYLRSLAVPAALGALVWWRRPPELTVDDDPYVPLYSLLCVVWAIFFVTRWRARQCELAFLWGSADAARADVLRPQYKGLPAVDEVSGEAVLTDPLVRAVARRTLSVVGTLASLLVPVVAMICSLNLQGYIVAATGPWMGVAVFLPRLAGFAAPGAIFEYATTDRTP